MSSLRTRLGLVLVTGVGPVLGVAAFLLAQVASGWLVEDFDRRLVERAQHLARDVGTGDPAPRGFDTAEGGLFEIWLDQGVPWARSPDLTGDLPRLLPEDPALSGGTAELTRYRDHPLPDGSPGRLVQLDRPAMGETPAVTVVVAHPRGALETRLGRLRRGIGAAALALLAVVGLVAVWGSAWALRPLAALGREIRGLESRSLDKRLALPHPPAELRPVVEHLDRWLDRLDLAFERERRWSSHVAHELRTPIAELRSLAEVGLHRPGDREAVVEFLGDVRDIALQMEDIVHQLLSMARSESGLEKVAWEPVSLVETLDTAWGSLAGKARARGIERRSQGDPGLLIESDRTKLQLMLTNLLANAVAHSPEGSTIGCRVFECPDASPTTPAETTAGREQGRDRICLEISNPAPALEADDLPRLFDRFWRKDPARTGSLHAGLGLSLVRVFAELLEIRVEPRLDRGHLVLRLGAHGAGRGEPRP